MFLRRCVRRKNGKRHTYWALVESYRTGRGSRQRVVAYLGELKRSQQSGWAQLGRRLSGKARPRPSLFDPPHYDDPADDEEPVLVRLKGVALERLRDFGDVWLALGLWRLLELDKLLAERLKDLALANRRLGRLAQRYWRGAGKARLVISWKRNARWSDRTALSEGCYLLRTNLNETDPATLWKRYIQLTEAEWAFRISKDELEIRPIWHQTEPRVLAHILVCFLAYVLWKTLAGWMHRAGLGDGRCWPG